VVVCVVLGLMYGMVLDRRDFFMRIPVGVLYPRYPQATDYGPTT
jgi:hypothetical protein